MQMAFGIPCVIVNQEDIAPGRKAIIEKKIAADHFAPAVPLDKTPHKKIRRERVEESIAQSVCGEFPIGQCDPVEIVAGFH